MGHETNRWKTGLLGMLGGFAGVLAMDYYFSSVAPLVSDALEKQQKQSNGRHEQSEEHEGSEQQEPEEQSNGAFTKLKDISLIGKHHKEGEVSTVALGRMLYKQIKGYEPRSKELKVVLSYEIHWVYGMVQGGVYGTLRSNAPLLDIAGGAAFGAGLWLFGDEMAVPMLGLQPGPGGASTAQHLNRLDAHLVYGVVTALTTQALRRLVPPN